MAQVQLLKFDDAIASFAKAYEVQKDVAINNQLEAAESYKSNYDRYFSHVERGQFVDALKCVNYLVDKIPNNQTIKMYKV